MALCSVSDDKVFGPQVDEACRPFDFTLNFEDIFLTCLPPALFLLLLPGNIALLLRSRGLVKHSMLLGAKLLVLIAILACQTAFLAVRVKSSYQSNVTLPADTIRLVATIGAIALSYLGHSRSKRPSTLLILYLSTVSLLDIARVRTLWLIKTLNAPAIVLSITLALTIIALILESIEKKKSVRFVEKDATPEQFSGFWNLTSFSWLAATFHKGYSKIISVEDLPTLDPPLTSELLHDRLEIVWNRCNKQKKHSLLKACLHAFMLEFIASIIPRLALTGFTFAQPFLIDTTILFIGTVDGNSNVGNGLIGAWTLVYLGMAASTALYWYQTFRFLAALRGSLISLIYRRTVQTRAVDLGSNTAITLMGTDAERIVRSFRSIHELWACLIDIAVAIYLLERQLFVACLVPTIIVAVFIGASFKLSGYLKSAQRQWVEKVETRLKVTSSMLGDMKAVKMLGLTQTMSNIVHRLREVEIQTSKRFRKLIIWEIFFSNAIGDLAPMATFAFYVIIAVVQKNTTLLTAQAFTSLSLIALLTRPVLIFTQTVPSFIQCLSCFDRIQEYCGGTIESSVSVHPSAVSIRQTGSSISMVDITAETLEGPVVFKKDLISFHGQDFGWSRGSTPILKDINVKIEKRRLTMITGPVGSGKSTLLESILGETIALQSQTKWLAARTAYCAQQPWLINATIKQNIIGSSPIDEAWYTAVLEACGLEKDLSQLRNGDQTIVGSNGLNVSGGQKQRVSLARAVYARCSVVLLDDVFSGMDSHTVNSIALSLFGPQGYFRKHSTTVVLATHTQRLLQFADTVIVLRDGRIEESGKPEDLNKGENYSGNFYAQEADSSSDDVKNNYSPGEGSFSDQIDQIETEATELLDPRRQTGDTSVYIYYMKSAGYLVTFNLFFFMLLWTFCSEFPTVWVKWWSEANELQPNNNVGMYLGVYAMFSIAAMIFMVVGCWFLLINIISNTAMHLHSDLLKSALNAPFRFFHSADTGTLTNRFSQDMELIDMDLPMLAINFVASLCTCSVKVAILVAFAKYLSATIPFVVAVLVVIQKFYLRTSRQVRLLDIEAKAPLYTHFLESVSGAVTVRAFGWQSERERQTYELLNTSQRPVYLLNLIQQWLALVLDLVIGALVVILIATVVKLPGSFDPGSVGVALVMIMTFNQNLTYLIKFWTQLETSIGAVARVKGFVANTEQEETQGDADPTPEDWPRTGQICITNLSASHSPDKAPVLKSLSMSIESGEKIAICGRSGSGKTSLLLCMLKMLDIQDGSVVIDGVDISDVGCADIRKRINVVPQDPFLMPGTLRFNIDPFGKATDREIIQALQRVRIWDLVCDEGGLEKETNPAQWSVGQRQLLCLARAMVRQSRILILDEATSSVDHETESIMQNIIETEFCDQTVFAVMHRLKYATQYGKIAVLDDGRLAEFDSPHMLLSRDSIFATLYNSSKR